MGLVKLSQLKTSVLRMKNYADKKFETISAHISNKSNPHKVTASQVGALPSGGTAYDSSRLNGKTEDKLSVLKASSADNSTKCGGKKIWTGPESGKGSDSDTIYFCY